MNAAPEPQRPGSRSRVLQHVRQHLQHDELNFLLTNRVPRLALTRFIGWYSRLESPLLTRASIALWRLFTELDLSESPPVRYRSLQQCFTRPLRPGMRPVDADAQAFTSPCDAIVGACGTVHRGLALQAKGMRYALADLLGSAADAAALEGAPYVTLRLTSAMYHRFHAPHDARLRRVRYLSGDTWNVNPPALARIAQLYCRNERAALHFELTGGAARGTPFVLVPVAAILVASIRLHALDVARNLRALNGRDWACDAACAKGAELGWFEHGSTIVVFGPQASRHEPQVVPGARVRMGQALLRLGARTEPPPSSA